MKRAYQSLGSLREALGRLWGIFLIGPPYLEPPQGFLNNIELHLSFSGRYSHKKDNISLLCIECYSIPTLPATHTEFHIKR